MRKLLDNYCSVINGGAWSEGEYVEEGISVLRVSNMVSGTVVSKDDKFLSEASRQTYAKHELKTRDILIATVGSHPSQQGSVVGRTVRVPSEWNRAYLNQNAACLRINIAKGVDPDFFWHLTNTVLFKHHIESRARGSANQVRMAIGELKKFAFDFPDLPTQRKIAAILTAYDDLIETNRRRIALLEQMAEELYREWFVRMRFPGHEKTKFVKGVPEGWVPIKIGERVTTQYGYTASANDNPTDPKFLRITDIVPDQIDWNRVPHCPIGESDEEKYLLREGDIVVARTGATVGYAKRIHKLSHRAVFASYLVRMVPKKPLDSIYFGMAVESQAFKDFIQGFVTGAAQPQANAATMSLFGLYYPGEELLKRFNRTVEPLFDQKDTLITQGRNLTQTRDLLLPRLISGKLSVEDLDIQFPPRMADSSDADLAESSQ